MKRISIKEFREFGYLQELNRQFLHPLGLALEIVTEQDGTERLGGVWDYRADPEGIYYGPETLSDPEAQEKANRVRDEMANRAKGRQHALGFIIQPIK